MANARWEPMTEASESGAAEIRTELLLSIDRWRATLPSEDQEGNTYFLGIADRAITLTSALLHEVTQVLMHDAPLRDRATLGEHIDLIKGIGRKRRTTCSEPPRFLVSKSESRTLDHFSALRNALAHPEGERFTVATLGRYRATRVAEILEVAASIASMTIIDETVCRQAAPDVHHGVPAASDG